MLRRMNTCTESARISANHRPRFTFRPMEVSCSVARGGGGLCDNGMASPLIEGKKRVGLASGENFPAVIDDALDLKIVLRAAALKRRKPGRLDEIAPLLADVDAGRRVARSLLAGSALMPDAAAVALNPCFTQKPGRPFVRAAGVLAEKFRLEISKQAVHGVIVVEHAPVALAVLGEVDGTASGR